MGILQRGAHNVRPGYVKCIEQGTTDLFGHIMAHIISSVTISKRYLKNHARYRFFPEGIHDGVMAWSYFPHYHEVDSLHKGPRMGCFNAFLVASLKSYWTNNWVVNGLRSPDADVKRVTEGVTHVCCNLEFLWCAFQELQCRLLPHTSISRTDHNTGHSARYRWNDTC